MNPALSRAFDRTDIGLSRFIVPAGAALLEPGDRADRLFIVREGLLGVLAPDATPPRPIGFVRRGETVGEMALLAGTPRTRRVVAMRDSVVEAMSADRLLACAADDPALMIELAQLVARRAGDQDTAPALPRAILIVGLDRRVDPRGLAEALAASSRALGFTAAVLDCRSVDAEPRALGRAEDDHDLIFVSAQADEDDWATACRRHVDRVLLLGHADRPPPVDCALCSSEPLQANGLVELALEHSAAAHQPTSAWMHATSTTRVHHLGLGPEGTARLARSLTGTGIGLALSGGGARAFAHVGAVRALHEAGVAIDAVAGTSMGAIVAAGVASGWDDHELDERMRDAFVTSNPLDDIALPIVAMTRGRKVEARLRRHFGDRRIEDLGIPFLCGSTNLTTGRYDRHEQGEIVDALRASISLPGILPPVVRDGCVLVDGGLLRNLPSEALREGHMGTVIGCDVSRAIGLAPREVMAPSSWIGWFASGAWRRGPPLVSILMRSATISSRVEIANARKACDLYVMPELDMIEIRDWKAYPRAVEAGYRAMACALDAGRDPLTHLRATREARRGSGQP